MEPGDIVFLTSDGISDNFDPVVGKFCVPQREKPQTSSTAAASTASNGPAAGATAPQATGGQQHRQNNKAKSQSGGTPSASLPEVEAYQRHELTLLRMEDLLNHGSGSSAALPGKARFFGGRFSRNSTG